VFELGKAGVSPVPSRSTIYRVLVRQRPGTVRLPARRQRRRATVRPPALMTRQASRAAEATHGHTGLNVVRPRAARCGRSTLTPPRPRR
jgi:hypothetical protein